MLKLREVLSQDAQEVYDIRNDEEILKFFFNSQKISFLEHQVWLEASLKNPARLLLAVTENEILASVVRFDVTTDAAEVSVFVGKAFWGKGIGSFALTEGEKYFKQRFPHCKRIIAKVLNGNSASTQLFNKAGYEPIYTALEKEIS